MNEHVLIVEDEKDTVCLLNYNLQKNGYRTETAHNGVEAIELLETSSPDLVLLDLMMPGINGWEVCDYIREKDQSMPVIMLTALSDEENRVKGLAIGADDYITKPFSVKELLCKVERYVRKERSFREMKIRAEKEKERLDMLIHEMKNSFVAIEGLVNMAERKTEKDRYLSHIRTSARHLNSLISDTSFLNHLGRSEDPLPLGPVNILHVVEHAVELLKPEADARGIDVRVLNSTSQPALGDSTAANQVLINLISNAIRYNRESGKIRIYFEEAGDRIDVFIRDTGVGIPKDEISKIFEKGYRIKENGEADGKGIGLYMVKRLMTAMKGDVGVFSQKDAGSLFTVAFRKSSNSNLPVIKP